MSSNRRDLVRRQFDLTWSLLDLHLTELVAEDFVWEPAQHCGTMRQDTGGTWVADFAESEPHPIPVPTIGWVTWHLGWWWTAALDHARGRKPRGHDEIPWPGVGEATIDWVRGLRAEWIAVLDQLSDEDLDSTASFPWPEEAGRTVADTVAWVNAELMKNTAEIGQLRVLRAATSHSTTDAP
ncbi:DinB family protein [Saccharomonospora xinjiangensis]|uniref:DinB-like domain-containing protein n=1 Tax=Saccharomonospora xinjiangensis XJ-54 TaxID=882086 RepID=I0V8X6_9PSEU|nr:DinB family protein [Saccharomonospora xinjiangensis]EID56579.1 hypothetical protein SacxiDRAFT_4399 [Saccharomonospora xinjiangensis XJ-54]